MIRVFHLRFDRTRRLTRCARCDCLLEPVARESVEDEVPSAVRGRQRDFFRWRLNDSVAGGVDPLRDRAYNAPANFRAVVH